MTNRIRSSGTALVFFVSLVTLTSPFEPTGSAKAAQDRTSLTFADRVAYQYAIEEVYWRHRIWPKENPGPKPSLDAVVSRAKVEKKVSDYLRNSQALADRQRPITSEQLQAEMNRMVNHTKQPDVLRELFTALNNDPFVIAECLARPNLAKRVRAERGGSNASTCQSGSDLDAESNREAIQNSRPSAVDAIARGAADPPQFAYTLPEISLPLDCTNDTWTSTTLTNAPDPRFLHTAVWTGSEMIVWGGNAPNIAYNTGGRYNPATDSWNATSIPLVIPCGELFCPLEGRFYHTAVWTGTDMIVWGGLTASNAILDDGAKYDPFTNGWSWIQPSQTVSARFWHTAVWTGSEMIIWGGAGAQNFNTGGRYHPDSNSWTATTLTGAPDPHYKHTAVWTGTEMIVWGGEINEAGGSNTGGRYNPTTDSWIATSTTNAPSPRRYHTAVWLDNLMIVWGGDTPDFPDSTGGRYDPNTDSWTPTSLINAPDFRAEGLTAVSHSSEMIVWGGWDGSGSFLNSGGRYNPSTDTWAATPTDNAPEGRYYQTAVWTGTEMIVWGGYDSNFFNTGGRYCAQVTVPAVTSALSRKTHGGAGTFDVNLPLTGTPGIECRSSGATHDYTMVVTFSGNVTVTGNPQAQVTLGSGCVGSSGTCTGSVTVSGNTVTVPLTNIANVQTINVRINGVNNATADTPATDFTIPMSILIGDTNGNRAVNAGDVAQTKGRLGQSVDATNFRSDANANGTINAGDVSIVKSNLGTGLP